MSAPDSNKKPDLIVLALIVVAILAGVLSDGGRGAVTHPQGASPWARALAWPYHAWLTWGHAELNQKGQVGNDLWLDVFLSEGIAIIVLVVIGWAVWKWNKSRREHGDEGNHIR